MKIKLQPENPRCCWSPEVTIYLLDHEDKFLYLRNSFSRSTCLVAAILMLPVYKAISFKEVIGKGARTRPWVVFVRTPMGLRPYVVKLFEPSLIEHSDSVTNEVVGNILAKEFGLKVPKAALIDFDDSFVASLRDFDLIDSLEYKDQRIKFGTELLEGNVSSMLSFTTPSEARKAADIDSIFAFDNLIRNADRNKRHTNLLVRSDEIYLIDHELAFNIPAEGVADYLKAWQWPNIYSMNHACCEYLKRSYINFKTEYFSEFEEYLRLLNVNVLNPYFDQLIKEGYSANKHPIISNYLLEIKQNSSNFVNALRGKIS